MDNECKSKLKDKTYLVLKSKYSEGKCWDDNDEDEDDAEFCNYALKAINDGEAFSNNHVPTLITVNLSVNEYKSIIKKLTVEMFHLHTSLITSNEKFAARNVMLIKKNKDLEQILFQIENLKEGVEYLRNKIPCSSQIESAL